MAASGGNGLGKPGKGFAGELTAWFSGEITGVLAGVSACVGTGGPGACAGWRFLGLMGEDAKGIVNCCIFLTKDDTK